MKYLFYHDWRKNYGDILSPYILDALEIPYTVTDYTHCNMIMIGSIATQAKKDTHVYGSGFMWRTDPVCKEANWHWVRGPISRQKVLDAGGTCPELYGDPAMLLPHFWEGAPKVHDIGFVPHYIDYHECKAKYPDEYVINLVSGDPKQITEQITSCRTIVSSSLHGLIVAHAYGIPAAWVKFSNKLDGDDMKFHDHFLSLGIEPVLSSYEEPVFTLNTFNTQPLIDALRS